MKWQIFKVFGREASLYKRHPILWLATIVAILIPTLYTVIYLGAVWNPYQELDQLPAGLTNLDEGTEYRNTHYNLGKKVISELEKKKPFKFIPYKSEKDAEEAVRLGEVYFALVIPADFSRRVLPGTDAGSLKLISSQGTSFISTLIAERFIAIVEDNLSNEIEVKRWEVVLSSKGLNLLRAILLNEKQKAEDMAIPITTTQKELAPIESNGQGFAPYFMSLSLWLGVIVASFLFRLIVFPVSVASLGNRAKVLGKGLIPLSIALLGGCLLGVVIQQVMGVTVKHPLGYYLVLLVSGLTYSTIILALIRLVGDAGKLIAVIFLVIQIASAGGAYPIELSPPIYEWISSYLPLTFTVKGLRATMFGSYGGAWLQYIFFMMPWIIVCLSLSFLASKRFRYVEDGDYGPALDLSFKK